MAVTWQPPLSPLVYLPLPFSSLGPRLLLRAEGALGLSLFLLPSVPVASLVQEGHCGSFPAPFVRASEERIASHALVPAEAYALQSFLVLSSFVPCLR